MFCKLKIEGVKVVFAFGFQQNPKIKKQTFRFWSFLIIRFYFYYDLIEIDIECLHHLQPILVEIH